MYKKIIVKLCDNLKAKFSNFSPEKYQIFPDCGNPNGTYVNYQCLYNTNVQIRQSCQLALCRCPI